MAASEGRSARAPFKHTHTWGYMIHAHTRVVCACIVCPQVFMSGDLPLPTPSSSPWLSLPRLRGPSLPFNTCRFAFPALKPPAPFTAEAPPQALTEALGEGAAAQV